MLGARPSVGSSTSSSFGAAQHGAADHQHLAFAAAQIAGLAVHQHFQLREIVDDRIPVVILAGVAAEFEIFPHGQIGKDLLVLRNVLDAQFRRCRRAGRPTRLRAVGRRSIPAVGLRNPAMLLSSVVLPAPLRPTQATTWLAPHAHVDVEQHLRFAVGDVEPGDRQDLVGLSSCHDGSCPARRRRRSASSSGALPDAAGVSSYPPSAMILPSCMTVSRCRKSSTCEILCSTIRMRLPADAPAQHVQHALDLGFGEPGERLVEQQHLGLGQDRHRDLQAPLFAQAEMS